jgi:hypothetical protein
MCAAGFYFGRGIPFAQQWPLFEALRTTAAIIFAVVGAWLAIIYPERLKFSFGKKSSRNKGSANVGVLLYPAVYSTIILICVLFIGILAPILKQIPIIMVQVVIFRGLSFLLLTVLTLWQIAVVIMTAIPADLVKSNVDEEQATQEVLQQRSRLVRTRE